MKLPELFFSIYNDKKILKNNVKSRLIDNSHLVTSISIYILIILIYRVFVVI